MYMKNYIKIIQHYTRDTVSADWIIFFLWIFTLTTKNNEKKQTKYWCCVFSNHIQTYTLKMPVGVFWYTAKTKKVSILWSSQHYRCIRHRKNRWSAQHHRCIGVKVEYFLLHTLSIRHPRVIVIKFLPFYIHYVRYNILHMHDLSG